MSNTPGAPVQPQDPRDWQQRVDSLTGRLESLEWHMQRLRQDLMALRADLRRFAVVQDLSPEAVQALGPQDAQEPPVVVPGVPPTRPPVAPPPAPPVATPVPGAKAPAIAPGGPVVPSLMSPAPVPAGTVWPARATAGRPSVSSLEARIGGAWLSWLGGVGLLLGAIWLFTYSIQNNWITPWMQICTGWVAAAVLLVLGEWVHRRGLPWLAAAIGGVGLGVGYIAGYGASPLLHGLITLTASYMALSAVTAAGLVQAVRLRQLSTAMLALFGGLLPLVLLHSPHPTLTSLVSYLFVLSVGALGAGQLRSWPILRYLAWPGVTLLILLYLASKYEPGTELTSGLTLLWGVFLLFQVDLFGWRLRRPDELSSSTSLLAGLNATALLLATWRMAPEAQVIQIVGGSLFAVAGLQTLLGYSLWTLRGSERNRRVSISFFGQAALAAALGLPVTFDRLLVPAGWAAQAAVIALLVGRVRSALLRLQVVVLLAGGIAYIVAFFYEPFLVRGDIPARSWMAALLAAAGVLTAALSARRYGQSSWWFEQLTGEACAALAGSAAVIAGATLVSADPSIQVWVWTTIAVALALGLLSYPVSALRLHTLMTVALLAAAGLVVNVVSGALEDPGFHSQSYSFDRLDWGPLLHVMAALAALGLWNTWLLRSKIRDQAGGAVLGELVAAAAILGLLLVLREQIADDNVAYAVIAAAAVAVVLAVAGKRWPAAAYDLWAVVTWGVAVIYWILAATLWACFTPYDAVRALWAQVPPFTNAVLTAGLGLIATALLIIHVIKCSPRFGDVSRATMTTLVGAVAGYLLVHGLSFEVDRWFQANGAARFADPVHAERVALSVLWALLALAYVVVGLAMSVRGLRIFGLLLFAVTAAKVILLDMARVAVVYRALSAMGLGVLALLGAYAYQRVRRQSDTRDPVEP